MLTEYGEDVVPFIRGLFHGELFQLGAVHPWETLQLIVLELVLPELGPHVLKGSFAVGSRPVVEMEPSVGALLEHYCESSLLPDVYEDLSLGTLRVDSGVIHLDPSVARELHPLGEGHTELRDLESHAERIPER